MQKLLPGSAEEWEEALLTGSDDPTGTVVVLRPISAGQTGIGNRRTGIGRMDKLSISGIDANMGNVAAFSGEEYNISGE